MGIGCLIAATHVLLIFSQVLQPLVLSRLVQSLPRMIIKDEMGKQVKLSLEAAKLAHHNASLGVYDASAVFSRQARSMAEDAFFHHLLCLSATSRLNTALLYTRYVLALPLLTLSSVPVLMHVILAALREWRRYKQEKAKYVFWKTAVKTAS